MEQQFQSQVQPFLKANCYKCHGDGKHKGDVALDRFTTFGSIRADRETWRSVHDMLEDHKMPPKRSTQPPAEQAAQVIRFAADALDFVDPAQPRDPGFVPIHRLNRNEYNNTIRDLVGVDFQPAEDFPADDTGYGFDNIADVLSMSPLLAEKYLAAAEQVMDKAIVTENPNKPVVAHFAAQQMTGGTPLHDGHRLLKSMGQVSLEGHFIAGADYEFRIEAESDPAGNEAARMMVLIGDRAIGTFDVKNSRGHAKVFTVRVNVDAGDHEIAFAFLNDFRDPKPKNPRRRERGLIVDSLEIEGPLDLPPPPPSDIEKRLLFCGPADGAAGESCAANIIRRFASRAFRRPATDEEVAGLLSLYRSAREQGESFPLACKVPLTAVLVSPQFLYRIELDPPSGNAPPRPHVLNDFELATRLSYFLWSSTPDDELLELAGQKKLHELGVLDAQVRRMLADPRSNALIVNFAGQWLELRNLSQANPDPKQFPQFPKLRDDMRREGELFFEGLVREDKSVLDLLDANYTFLNERLAKFYGIEGVAGERFRRVALSGGTGESAHRGGVMTMAAVLTVTALPNRTSPVKRGKFILDQILGTPPPPPPPDVPALSDKATDVEGSTLRQRLEAHRANPSCASCHARMDPLGFALENFDAIGRWRERDGKFPIDSAGTLPNGESLDGPAGLRKLLLAHRDQFLRSFVQRLMTYALGRGPDWYDVGTVKEICDQAARDGYRVSGVIDGIVHSDAFLKRRAKGA